MTDDSVPPASEGSAPWDLDHDDDESSTDEDFFSTLKQRVARHVYFDRELTNDQPTTTTTNSSTTSDLLARCRAFLPLLTDANRVLRSKIDAGENVRIELDSEDEEEDGQTIEMNLMFCPNDESSSSDDDEDETPPAKKPVVNIVELPSEDRSEEEEKEETVQ